MKFNPDRKERVEEMLDLDMKWLKEHDYLIGHKSGGITWKRGDFESTVGFFVRTYGEDKFIEFNYVTTRQNGDKEKFNYRVQLETTPCNYGGNRYWFLCPLKGCGKRVSKLYLGKDYFGCRHCYDLTYESRNETRTGKYGYLNAMYKAERKAEKLQEQIKIPFRKGMPTKKQERLMEIQGQASKSANQFLKFN